MDAAMLYIQGQPDECYAFAFGNREEMVSEIRKNGMPEPQSGLRWLSFERDNCPRWTDPDADGAVILDYALFLQ
jgi:hypothetical protein